MITTFNAFKTKSKALLFYYFQLFLFVIIKNSDVFAYLKVHRNPIFFKC